MATGNRMLIMVLALVILSGGAAAFALEWTGKQGAAIFTALATTALGVLCPSPLRMGEPAAEKVAGDGDGAGGGDAAAAP